jgi:hypothetical protein
MHLLSLHRVSQNRDKIRDSHEGVLHEIVRFAYVLILFPYQSTTVAN